MGVRKDEMWIEIWIGEKGSGGNLKGLSWGK